MMMMITMMVLMKIRTGEDGMMTSQTSAMITGGMTDCGVDYQGTSKARERNFRDGFNVSGI